MEFLFEVFTLSTTHLFRNILISSSLKSEIFVAWQNSNLEWCSMLVDKCQNILILFIYLILYSVLHTNNHFSFIFSNINISIFNKKSLIKTKHFLLEKKHHGPWVSLLKPTMKHKMNNKPENLSYSSGKLGGGIYVPCLLLIITLRFTWGKRKFWWMMNKFQDIIPRGRVRNGTHGPWYYCCNKKHLF